MKVASISVELALTASFKRNLKDEAQNAFAHRQTPEHVATQMLV
jgi:hypothetical protein